MKFPIAPESMKVCRGMEKGFLLQASWMHTDRRKGLLEGVDAVKVFTMTLYSSDKSFTVVHILAGELKVFTHQLEKPSHLPFYPPLVPCPRFWQPPFPY